MFSTGQIIFAILFFVGFLLLVIISYNKDLKRLKGIYSGVKWVIFGFIVFVSLLVILKRISVS